VELERVVQAIASKGRPETVAGVAASAVRRKVVRRLLLSYLDRRINRRLENVHYSNGRLPPRVAQDKAYIFRALAHSVDRALARGNVSEAVVRGMTRGIVNAFLGVEHNGAAERFRQEHNGRGSPNFLLISPGKLCNLRCKGCYASSGADTEKLDWEIFDRIISEAKTLWGVGLIVISGGEPLAYRSHGKGVLDAAAKHQDVLFLMYTNGTLIDERMAAQMAEVGNITPAISVEGWEERTDERRGGGTFQKVLMAAANLRQAGVPFGISLTATCDNCEEILSDEFVDFFFEEQGAIYGWIFQYMPIGRGFTLDLLPTPEQRAWMWQRTWQLVRERGYFLPDFWNLGTCTDGCIAAGRQSGYLYFDWNGNVTPCVFVPYSPVNVNAAYREGKTLNDILNAPFFEAIREWQDGYGYAATRPEECSNWIMPCIIRDHHHDFRRILETTKAEPADRAAAQALLDPAYSEGLIRYDEAVARLLDPVWEKEYLES
jgi:MoaA/NifB/PqqE/SkfB family radical SAM enzyme